MIGAGFAAFAAVGLAPSVTHADDLMTTYALDPLDGSDCASCAACSACRSHAANKLFSSSKAADAGRAHTGCRCGVVEGQQLSSAVFKSVFESDDVADRRHASTQELLGAEVQQHTVPLVSGALPVIVLAAGAGAILYAATQRQSGSTDPT